jgi:hypothetical protein
MSGNFLRPDIDRPVLIEIIKSHTDVLFECFGAYESKNSNLGGSSDQETIDFIEVLKQAPNVILHGMVSPETLAKELRRMDAFLICYNVEKDQSKGTNYHKVMEYLVFGRPVVSNKVSAYSQNRLVFQATDSDKLSNLFNFVIQKFKSGHYFTVDYTEWSVVSTYRQNTRIIIQ